MAELPARSRSVIGSVPVYRDLPTLLARHSPDATVVTSPIHLHAEHAAAALHAGSDVLVEKPPVTGLGQLDALTRVQARTGRAVQVGFQSLGSAAVPALRTLAWSGTLGNLRGVAAAGAWVRGRGYFDRAPWAGRRTLDGRPVVDGCLTNPFAHAVATALAVAAPDRLDRPLRQITLELLRANEIESDDTACARLDPGAGYPPVVVAATLCAQRDHDPFVVVHGETASATLHYELDRLTVVSASASAGEPAAQQRRDFSRTDLLENLLAHRAAPDEVPLLVPLSSCRSFTSLVQTVQDAPDPVRPPTSCWYDEGEGASRHRVIQGIDALVVRAATNLALFSELGAPPWAWN